MLTRRRLFSLSLASASPLALSACGFHPLYMPSSGSADGPAAAELAAINVPVMAERTGQLMRQALQEHLERFGILSAKRYDLLAPMAISTDLGGIDPNTNITRFRYYATAAWSLRRRDPSKTLVKTGRAYVLDGVNIIGSQFFSSDIESDAIFRNFASTLADQVVMQLAGYFDQEARKAKKPDMAPVEQTPAAPT